MKRARIGGAARWRLAVPIAAVIAGLATTAPDAAQAAGAPGPGGSATAREAAARLAAAPVPPMPGSTPAVQACDVHCRVVYYTGSDRRAYSFVGVTPTSLGRRLIGGPGAGPFGGIFGRGTDNALWQDLGDPFHLGKWASLGGRLTSRPGVAEGALKVKGGRSTDVVVRGTDGAVWDRELSTAWRPWRGLGGRVLAGSGPAAVNVGGKLYVLAVGTDRAVWVKQTTDGTRWSCWRRLGGRFTGDLGAASPAPGVGIVFARGRDNAVWYNQFAGTTKGVTPGWHSLGGRLTSGVGAWGGSVNPDVPREVIVLVMGTDNHIWQRTGSWPALGPWAKVR